MAAKCEPLVAVKVKHFFRKPTIIAVGRRGVLFVVTHRPSSEGWARKNESSERRVVQGPLVFNLPSTGKEQWPDSLQKKSKKS